MPTRCQLLSYNPVSIAYHMRYSATYWQFMEIIWPLTHAICWVILAASIQIRRPWPLMRTWKVIYISQVRYVYVEGWGSKIENNSPVSFFVGYFFSFHESWKNTLFRNFLPILELKISTVIITMERCCMVHENTLFRNFLFWNWAKNF